MLKWVGFFFAVLRAGKAQQCEAARGHSAAPPRSTSLCWDHSITAGLVPVLPVCSVPIVFEKEFAVP